MQWNEKKEGGGLLGVNVCVCVMGVVAEMREKLYQADQPSVLLQSPDKAGTAGGETMCIKTSWRSMASFCQRWKRQKGVRVRDKTKKKPKAIWVGQQQCDNGQNVQSKQKPVNATRRQGGTTEGHNQDWVECWAGCVYVLSAEANSRATGDISHKGLTTLKVHRSYREFTLRP